jgi:hypothetical protein
MEPDSVIEDKTIELMVSAARWTVRSSFRPPAPGGPAHHGGLAQPPRPRPGPPPPLTWGPRGSSGCPEIAGLPGAPAWSVSRRPSLYFPSPLYKGPPPRPQDSLQALPRSLPSRWRRFRIGFRPAAAEPGPAGVRWGTSGRGRRQGLLPDPGRLLGQREGRGRTGPGPPPHPRTGSEPKFTMSQSCRGK